jgi:hypothetical protein
MLLAKHAVVSTKKVCSVIVFISKTLFLYLNVSSSSIFIQTSLFKHYYLINYTFFKHGSLIN